VVVAVVVGWTEGEVEETVAVERVGLRFLLGSLVVLL